MSEVDILYICDYGQSGFNICPLMDEKCDKKDSCNLRAVVPYKQLQQANKTIESQKGLIKKFVESEQQLKVENDELKNKLALFSDVDYAYESTELENSLGLANKYVNKYKATLDEIEEIVEEASEDYRMPEEVWNKIQELIKQAKEGE